MFIAAVGTPATMRDKIFSSPQLRSLWVPDCSHKEQARFGVMLCNKHETGSRERYLRGSGYHSGCMGFPGYDPIWSGGLITPYLFFSVFFLFFHGAPPVVCLRED